jgi:hypothetical protein
MESPMPIVDEGWWNSVLAEESRHAPPPPVRQSGKTEVRGEAGPAVQAQTKPTADWNQVKDLYSRDQIVSLNVTGYNRGGLLVEGRDSMACAILASGRPAGKMKLSVSMAWRRLWDTCA